MEQLELMALKPARRRPVEPILRTADIEGEYRWTLRRSWGAGPPVGWICLNPSVASADRDDPTCWEMMCHSLRLGFGSMVVTNIYAYRATSPLDLKRWIGGARECPPMTYENHQAAARALKGIETIICGWGAHARQLDVECFLEGIAWELVPGLDMMFITGEGPYPIPLWCLGRTGSGAPKHPLARGRHRIPRDQALLGFDP